MQSFTSSKTPWRLGLLCLAVMAALSARAQPSPPALAAPPADGLATPVPPSPDLPPPPVAGGRPAGAERGAPPPPMGRAPLPPRPAAPAGPDAIAPRAGPVEGRVTAYLLSPEAEVAGVILDNGSELRVPPHLGVQLAGLVKPGERVRFSGESTPAPDAATAPAPWTIVAISSGRTLTDTAPAPGMPVASPMPERQGQSALQSMKTSGTVKRVLTGPRGEANGILLDNGTQVAIPPQAPDAADRLLTVGSRINVEGYGRTSSYGTALQATVLSRPGETPVSIYAAAPLR